HPRHKEDLMGTLQGASDHLHKLARTQPGAFGRRHKEESLHHARALDRHHGMISGMKEDAPPPTAPTDVAPMEQPGEGDPHDFLDEKSLKLINEKLDRVEAPLRRINPSALR